MLFYGDAVHRVDPRDAVRSLAAGLERLGALPPGRPRHEDLVALFIQAGELTQGLADHAFDRMGHDGEPGPHDAAMDLLLALAKAVGRSWRSGFLCSPAPSAPGLEELAAASLPDRISIRKPEGYAFYATYPEGWYEAAAVLKSNPVRVIGIRSIGTGLAAMIAAATGAPPPLTVRPVGPPFRREIRVARDVLQALCSDRDARIAIADEGPGLSGSSFAAVATLLEQHGVDPLRLHFFPSHAGEPGGEADPAWRARWKSLPRTVVDVDALVLGGQRPAAHRLATWAGELIGAPVTMLEDVSGGGWRTRFRDRSKDPLPADPRTERRKFLLHAGGREWLARFAGLGRIGTEKLRMGRTLHAAGYVPEPLGIAHGFIIEPWLGDASPLMPSLQENRTGLVALLGGYLGFRAKHFPAGPWDGARLDTLGTMACCNASDCLRPSARSCLDDWTRCLSGLERRVRRVRTDNRLHTWEWLRLPGGRLLKTDAVDHHAGHDLVGSQDISWDIAGAACEFDLAADEIASLIRHVEAESGFQVERGLVEASSVLYAAFQFGAFTLAAEAGHGPSEAASLAIQAGRYASRLKAAFE